MAYSDIPTIDDERLKMELDHDAGLCRITSVNTAIDDSEMKLVYTSGASRLEFTAKDMGGFKMEWLMEEVDHSVSGDDHIWVSSKISHEMTPV